MTLTHPLLVLSFKNACRDEAAELHRSKLLQFNIYSGVRLFLFVFKALQNLKKKKKNPPESTSDKYLHVCF